MSLHRYVICDQHLHAERARQRHELHHRRERQQFGRDRSWSSPLDGITPNTGPPVTTIFDNAFSGTALAPSWRAVEGSNPSNNERECYTPLNISVTGGYLRETSSVSKSCSAHCRTLASSVCPYTSGAVEWSTFSFTYVTVTVRSKFSGGVGT